MARIGYLKKKININSIWVVHKIIDQSRCFCDRNSIRNPLQSAPLTKFRREKTTTTKTKRNEIMSADTSFDNIVGQTFKSDQLLKSRILQEFRKILVYPMRILFILIFKKEFSSGWARTTNLSINSRTR